MSSLRVLQEGHMHHSFQRFSLKERLLGVELSRLGLCLSNAKAISGAIKALHATYRQRSAGGEDCQQCSAVCLLQPVSKLIAETRRLLNNDNLNFSSKAANQQADKKAQQEFFMQALRAYEGKITELSRKIKVMESTIQSYSNSGAMAGEEERFDEALSSFSFLDRYLALQKQKEAAVQACVESASRNTINSQIQCNSREKIQHPESFTASLLLKEKIVNERLKQKIALLRKTQATEKGNFDRLTKAIRETNSHIGNLHLEASINTDSNFLLEADHYARHWKVMKDTITSRLNYPPTPKTRLSRSKSCTVMQSNQPGEEESSLFLGKSISIDNQESLLDNLEYFISEEFIKDLVEHRIE